MKRRTWFSLLSLFAALATYIATPAACSAAEADLEPGFRDPPPAARPWAYWWWVNANIDEKTITRDLEEMQAKGIGGLLMFDARGYHDDHVPPPAPRTEFMSPEWRRLLKFSVQEAARLGLEMSINLSSCAGSLKGPWEVGDDGPKRLAWATVDVQGPQVFSAALPKGEWGRAWDVAVVAARQEPNKTSRDGSPVVVEVLDLSARVNDRGRLDWDVPAGRWTVIRFVCALMEDRPNDVDILSPSAVEGHFNRMAKAVLSDAGPLAGKTITHLYSVSWEGAIPTWTPGFERYFRQYAGYDLGPYLPVLAGLQLREGCRPDRFLRDYHWALAQCFMNHFYGTLRDLSHAAGLQWHSESGGPWNRDLITFRHADQLAFLARNDMPQGEFWWGRAGRFFNRAVAMTAHTYGRPKAAAESFTHMTYHWSASPAALKPLGDATFCDGINQLVWHTFTASPEEFGRPGIEYFAGTHLNPNVTWWPQAGAFLKYLARCQYLLQQGRSVTDVCCYTGDENYLSWGRGEKWTAKPTLTLGRGNTYDIVTTEVLLERLKAARGRLVLPEGQQYRLLVVDLADEAVPVEALQKIVALARAGATVVLGRRPERAVSLRDYPNCDQEVERLAAELWGPADAAAGVRTLGAGKLYVGRPLDEVLPAEQLLPDFEGPCDWTHRRTAEADLYFVAAAKATQADCIFRIAGREPELWDAAGGTIRPAVRYRPTDDGRTMVPLDLPDGGSVFVVFRRAPAGPRIAALTQGAETMEILGRSGEKIRAAVWANGAYGWQTASGKHATLDVAGLPEPQTLAGPWEVRFAPGGGAPPSATFAELTPWNEHPDPAIKFFSGQATYSKRFTLSAAAAKGLVRLQLGEIQHVARVRLNGRDLGVVWTAPWCADLTGAVREGQNELEIDVTNVWANRLIGDAALPPEKRITKTNVALVHGPREKNFKPYTGYSDQDPLVRSGLMGPVRVEFGREVRQ